MPIGQERHRTRLAHRRRRAPVSSTASSPARSTSPAPAGRQTSTTSADVARWYAETSRQDLERVGRAAGRGAGQGRSISAASSSLPAVTFLDARAAPFDSPSRPAVDVPAADGREGAVDLRRELRQRQGQGAAREAASSLFAVCVMALRLLEAGGAAASDRGRAAGRSGAVGRDRQHRRRACAARGTAVVVLEPKSARDVSAAGREAGDGSGRADLRPGAAAGAHRLSGGVPQQRRHAAQRARQPRGDAHVGVQRRDSRPASRTPTRSSATASIGSAATSIRRWRRRCSPRRRRSRRWPAADGSFAFADVPAGAWTVTVYTDGKRLHKDVEVTGGATNVDDRIVAASR